MWKIYSVSKTILNYCLYLFYGISNAKIIQYRSLENLAFFSIHEFQIITVLNILHRNIKGFLFDNIFLFQLVIILWEYPEIKWIKVCSNPGHGPYPVLKPYKEWNILHKNTVHVYVCFEFFLKYLRTFDLVRYKVQFLREKMGVRIVSNKE